MTSVLVMLLLAAPAQEPLVVSVGGQRLVEVPAGARGFALDNWDEGILEAKLLMMSDGPRLLLIGAADGKSALLFFGANGVMSRREIRVSAHSEGLIICDLCRVIGPKAESGSRVKMAGERVYVEGFAWSVEELARLAEARRQYPNVLFRATLHPRVLRDELVSASYVLWLNGFPQLRATMTGAALTVSAPVADRAKVTKLLAPFARRLQAELLVP